jgi:hypothetical protein
VGYAVVLNTASNPSATGGTFADTVTSNTGGGASDSLSVANYVAQSEEVAAARIIEMWGIDDAHKAEISWRYTRPTSTHDQEFGFRANIPAAALGGAGTNAAFNFLDGFGTIPLFKSDTPVVEITDTADDVLVVSWLTEYDNLPGASGIFVSPQYVMANRKSTLGTFVNPEASATLGAYGTSVALNSSDDRYHASTWYAILGWTVQVQCTTLALVGPDWGGQRIGGPVGALSLNSSTFFWDLSLKWGSSLIPVFNSQNKQNTFVVACDAESDTVPKVDLLMYELTTPNNTIPAG